MTGQLAIVAFPRFEASSGRLEEVRRRFDPLAALLAAHVTLVFPFEESLSLSELRADVDGAVRGIAPFAITLATPTLVSLLSMIYFARNWAFGRCSGFNR